MAVLSPMRSMLYCAPGCFADLTRIGSRGAPDDTALPFIDALYSSKCKSMSNDVHF